MDTRAYTGCVMGVLIGALSLGGVADAWAQYGAAAAATARPGAADNTVVIRKFEGVGRRGRVKTPEYRSNYPAASKPSREWGEVSATFDTTAEWIDELTVQYYVLARRMEGGRALFSLYRTTVRHPDVKRGRDHRTAAYLRPPALERFGDIVAIAVEFVADGKTLAEEAAVEGIKLPARWWQDQNVVGNKDVTARDGYLLDRSRTPFALVNVDDYEEVR